jgi:hypothetical protein
VGSTGGGGEGGSSGSGGAPDGDGAGGGTSLDGGVEDAPEGDRNPPERDAADGPTDVLVDRSMDAGGSTCALTALQFGGFQGYVRVNRPVQDDLTLEAWIKASTPGVMSGTNFWEGSGLLYADSPGDADDFGAVILGSKFAFGVGNPNTTIVSTSDVTTGAWVHVAATRRRSTGEIQVFVNGKLESSTLVGTQNRSLTAQPNLTIGGNAVDNRYFTGVIDEVRAWNVVRSATDITSTMRKRLTGTEPGLVGYWRFDEGSGITAADSSPSKSDAGQVKNNGDLFGPINWVASDAPVCP